MCFTVSVFSETHEIETAIGAVFNNVDGFTTFYNVSGFAHPLLPVVLNSNPGCLDLLQWGLIPSWTKTREDARAIAGKTLNARSETVFEKPSFKAAIARRRGLVPVNGFVEWRHESQYKQPYYIRSIADPMFTMGCIWEEWTNRETGELHTTFSLLTTQANSLLSYVHNSKQRMPLVIPANDREAWLTANTKQEIHNLMVPLADGQLEAVPVSRTISTVKVNTSNPDLIEPIGTPLPLKP